jgi:preprotein translocase subunit SecG
MSVLMTLILVAQMLSALAMIGLVLVQHGKGADMGAAFGSGASGSLFGATGGANFLSRATAVLAAVFFVCTLLLAYFGNVRTLSSGSVLEGAAVSAPAPVASESGTAAQIPGNAPAAQPVSAAASAPATPAK